LVSKINVVTKCASIDHELWGGEFIKSKNQAAKNDVSEANSARLYREARFLT